MYYYTQNRIIIKSFLGNLSEKKKKLELKKADLEAMAELFDIKKENLVSKFNQTNMIKEVLHNISVKLKFQLILEV